MIEMGTFKLSDHLRIELLIIIGLITKSLTSDCDVEWIYSDDFNSPGFKVTCSNIQKGEENLIRNISAYNAIILKIRNSTLYKPSLEIFENVPKIRELNIENSEIILENGSVEIFCKLEVLQILKLVNTKLSIIGKGTFSKLNRLKALNLNNINLSKINEGDLNLSYLDNLEFSRNNLRKIDDLPLCNLPNLRKINFAFNNLQILKAGLYECSENRSKFIENNHLNIELINLSNNRINNLSEVFTPFHNLISLNLRNNFIVKITNRDFSNTNLENLDLSNNSIETLHENALSSLIRLRKLNLSHNKFTKIHIEFLQNLNEINLSFNTINFRGLQISKLSSLKILDVSFNVLNGTSFLFNDFPTISTLNLNGNNLILTDEIFLRLGLIEKLFVSNNGILTLPRFIFTNKTSLIVLDLSENKLENLEFPYVFSNLSSLQILNLSYNSLSNLSHSLFVGLDDVRILDISGNKLKQLDYPLMLNNMRSLEILNIKNNLFSCNFLYKIVRYFSWKGVSYHSDNFTAIPKLKDGLSNDKNENIGGIECREEFIGNNNSKLNLDNTKNYSTFVVILSTAISAVLILLILIILKYYQFYTRTKYQCEQFELIED